LGVGDKVQAVLGNIPYLVHATPFLWDAKQLLIMWIFIYAFFKFAWAFRLSHYGAIMIGAAPLDADDCTRTPSVRRSSSASPASITTAGFARSSTRLRLWPGFSIRRCSCSSPRI
jgi:uncharacterized membrane protein